MYGALPMSIIGTYQIQSILPPLPICTLPRQNHLARDSVCLWVLVFRRRRGNLGTLGLDLPDEPIDGAPKCRGDGVEDDEMDGTRHDEESDQDELQQEKRYVCG